MYEIYAKYLFDLTASYNIYFAIESWTIMYELHYRLDLTRLDLLVPRLAAAAVSA